MREAISWIFSSRMFAESDMGRSAEKDQETNTFVSITTFTYGHAPFLQRLKYPLVSSPRVPLAAVLSG